MDTLKIGLTLLVGVLLLWWSGTLTPSGAAYRSIHAAGHRVGQVLPQGNYVGSRLRADQVVRVESSAGSQPERLPASVRQRQIEARSGFNPFRGAPIAPVLLILCALTAVLVSERTQRARAGDRGDRRRRLCRACVMVILVGVLIGVGFNLCRVFWTGVDDAFIERSTLVRADSPSIHVRGDTTLSMDRASLMMLYSAIVLTALPLMVLAATRFSGGWAMLRGRLRGSRVASTANGLLSHPVVRRRMSLRSSMGVLIVSYVLFTLALWSAPWSTTMARALWG